MNKASFQLELVKQVNQRCSCNDDVMKIQLTQIEENLTNLKEGQVSPGTKDRG